MPQAIASPEELEQFARNLKQFNTHLRENMSRLHGQFGSLGETWKDQEHQKFAREFEQTVRTLDHFLKVADEHIPFLLRKAHRLRDYLNQR